MLPRAPSQDDPAAPLTYQVFNPAAVPAARPSAGASSRGSYPEERTKAGLGLRVGLAVVGACVLLGTVAAIIMGSTDDPPRAANTVPSAGTAAAALAPVAPSAPPAPVAVVDPAPVAPNAVAAVTPSPPASVKPVASGKPKPAASAQPAGLKGAKVPPNPFGGPTLPTKRK